MTLLRWHYYRETLMKVSKAAFENDLLHTDLRGSTDESWNKRTRPKTDSTRFVGKPEGMALVKAKLPPIDSEMNEHDVKNVRSYTIGKSPVKHYLPSSALLQDSMIVDNWPAHASAHGLGISTYSSRDKKHLQQIVPKPKYLEQLEQYLEQELRCLGVSSSEPSQLRLQAFRKVFDYLIEDFRTYKPLLSAIKNEYEMVLTKQRMQIEQLQPLQQTLVALSEQSDQKVMALRDQEKQEVKDLKSEIRRLCQTIDDLKNDKLLLETQVSKLAENLSSTYLLYRDECDARKLLITDINELRYQQEEMMINKGQHSEQTETEREDPTTLRIALKRAREDEADASRRLNEMVANYGDVIPRRDYEQLQKHYGILEGKLETLKEDFITMQSEHKALVDVHKQVTQERDDFYTECETMKRSATPRPDWSRCSECLGEDRWKQLSGEKSSKELVQVLLNEIQGTNDSVKDYFTGLGDGDDVPRYLRHQGKVRNRRLNKRDCAILIHDIWKEKVLYNENEQEEKMKMSDYLQVYLQQRFGLKHMVVEWAYNLNDAVNKYVNNDNIALFNNVLNGKADEEIYRSRLNLINRLKKHLTQLDEESGETGLLTRENFSTALTECFRLKDGESIVALVKAAQTELNTKEEEEIPYKNLFEEDEEGCSGPFLEELKRQFLEEQLSYGEDIRAELEKKSLSSVGVGDLRSAIQATDPYCDPSQLDYCLRWAFNVETKEELERVNPSDLDDVISRLKLGNIRRAGMKP